MRLPRTRDIIRPELNFNPRTPCGVRHVVRGKHARSEVFQSTHPLRGATSSMIVSLTGEPFQSTHPLRGATGSWQAPSSATSDFNPRTPCGVRHTENKTNKSSQNFNPRTPCGVRLCHRSLYKPSLYFNPRTPCGVRQQNCRNIPGKFAQKLQNFCKAKQRAALSRVGQRESGRYFRPCAVRTSRGKPERFRFASDNERALRSVARL